MKIWIKMLLAIIVGILISFFLPNIKENNLINAIFKFFSELSINSLLYLTLLYLFLKSFIGFIWFKSNNSSKNIMKLFVLYTIISIFFSLIITVAVMNIGFFHPELNFNQKFDKIVEPENIGNIFLSIINKNIFTTFEGPAKYLLPVLFISMIVSLAAFYSGKKGYLFVDLVESLDAILDKIVRQILEFFPIAAIFTFSLFMKDDIFKYENLSFVIKPLFGIFVILVILFITYTSILIFYLKENIFKFYFGFLGAGLIAFVTGNSASSLIPLNEHVKKNIGIKREISDLLISLGQIFNKSGTIIVSSVVLFSILFIYSPDILTINFQLVLIIFSMFFSLFLDGSSDKGFLVLVSTILSFKILHLEQDSYLLFIISIPLFSRIGLFIDVLSNSLVITAVAKKMDLKEKRDYVEYI